MRRNGRTGGKALVFVIGHRRPSVAPLDAKYVRRYADGQPVLARSTSDTLDEALARGVETAADEPAPTKDPAAESAVDAGTPPPDKPDAGAAPNDAGNAEGVGASAETDATPTNSETAGGADDSAAKPAARKPRRGK